MLPVTSPDRFFLWYGSPESYHLARPAAFFTAAPVAALRALFLRAPWIGDVPLIRFCGQANAALGRPRFYLEPPGDDLCAIEGVEVWRKGFEGERASRLQLEVIEEVDSGRRIDATIRAAARIAGQIAGPAWELEAQHTDGLLAVGIATAKGRAVAWAPASVPGVLNVAACKRWACSGKIVASLMELRAELERREREA